MKKISITILTIILMLGVSGCMNNKEKKVEIPKNNINDNMIEYMNQKYDDTFEYLRPFGGSVGSSSKQIIVTSKKYPNMEIWVECDYSSDNIKYYDNYLDKKYEEETRDYLKNLLEDIFKCDIEITYNVDEGGTRGSNAGELSFEEYIDENANALIFRADVKENITEKDKNAIRHNIENKFVDEKLLKSVGTLYFNEADVKLFFVIDENGLGTFKWS